LNPNDSGTFTVAASGVAGIAQTSTTITGVSGSLKENASLDVSVTGKSVSDPFHLIGGDFSHGFYDQARELLFVANYGLNEIDVISGKDLSVQSRVPASQPFGMEQQRQG